MPVKITTFSRLAVLLELLDGPRHGYQLMKATAARSGSPCSAAQIYPFLAQLEKQKMVVRKSEGADGTGRRRVDGGREKHSYSLTPAGKKFVQTALGKMGQILDMAVAGKISECAHCSCKIYGKAVLAMSRGVKLPYCCMHCAKDAGARMVG